MRCPAAPCLSRLLPAALAGAAAIAPLLAQVPAPAAPRAPQPPFDRLLVANKAEHTLSIFDPAEKRELARLPTGAGPHEVAVAPSGRLAVVSDYGEQKPGATLTVVDLVDTKVLRTIALTWRDGEGEAAQERTLLRPHGLHFVAAAQVAVTSESARRLAIVDVDTGEVLRTVSTPQTTMHMVGAGGDPHLLAATSVREGSVALFDLREATVPPPVVVPTGAGAEGLAVHPTTGDVWVGNRGANTLSIVDRAAGKVVKELPTGDFPFRVTFTADGAFALVSCAEGGEVQIFDAGKRELVAAIDIHGDSSELSAMPMGLCVDPDGKRCYVACGRGEFIAVLDLERRAVIHRIPAGRGPDGIAFARVR